MVTFACGNDNGSGKSIVSPGAKEGLLPLTIPLVKMSPGMILDLNISSYLRL